MLCVFVCGCVFSVCFSFVRKYSGPVLVSGRVIWAILSCVVGSVFLGDADCERDRKGERDGERESKQENSRTRVQVREWVGVFVFAYVFMCVRGVGGCVRVRFGVRVCVCILESIYLCSCVHVWVCVSAYVGVCT